MNVVALICARGGSKGLPRKNVRLLAGKPLIAWAIEQAKSVARVSRIIVSTDSQEISSVAEEFGAEVPFIRPGNLARDDSPEWMVWRHALNYLKDTGGSFPDALIVVPATAPLRSIGDLENCLDEFEKDLHDVVITVTDAHRNPYFNMVKVADDGAVGLVIPPDVSVARRQDAPLVYDMTTVAYVIKPQFVVDSCGIFSGRVGLVHVPVDRALDIDSLQDFKLAEFLMADK